MAPPLPLRGVHLLLAALVLGPLLLAALVHHQVWPTDFGFPLDDTWIHLQFGRTLAAGDGLQYNAGEAVLGTTAPLWSALLALAHLLPGSPAGWAVAAGVLAHLLTVAGGVWAVRTYGGSTRAAVLAAAWIATSGWVVWGAVSGMEIALFSALSLLGIARADLEMRRIGSLPVALPLLALTTLLRPEAGLLVVLAAAELLWRRRFRQLFLGVLFASLVVLPWLAFATVATGSPIPTTFAVKAGSSGLHLPDLAYLRTVFWILFQFQPVVPLLAGGGLLALLLRGKRTGSSLLAALWLLALPLAFAIKTPTDGNPLVGNFGRYLFPLIPVAAVLAALAVAPLLRELGRRGRTILVLLCLAPGLALVPKAVGLYATNLANVRDGDLAAALWLKQHLPHGATIAVNDIGLIKYQLAEHRVLDLVGISHPAVRAHGAAAVAAGQPWWRGVLAYLEEERPDYVVVFSVWLPQLAWADGFVPVYRLEIPNNVTMGGDDIVVWSTPWTRDPLVGAPMTPLELAWPPRHFSPDDFPTHLQ